jgi:hypothetical protein
MSHLLNVKQYEKNLLLSVPVIPNFIGPVSGE